MFLLEPIFKKDFTDFGLRGVPQIRKENMIKKDLKYAKEAAEKRINSTKWAYVSLLHILGLACFTSNNPSLFYDLYLPFYSVRDFISIV